MYLVVENGFRVGVLGWVARTFLHMDLHHAPFVTQRCRLVGTRTMVVRSEPIAGRPLCVC